MTGNRVTEAELVELERRLNEARAQRDARIAELEEALRAFVGVPLDPCAQTLRIVSTGPNEPFHIFESDLINARVALASAPKAETDGCHAPTAEGLTMRRLMIEPNGWPCTLKECPPGHFTYRDDLCFKTEYRCATTASSPNGKIEAYCESGEFFVGGADTEDAREQLVVQPVVAQWIDED